MAISIPIKSLFTPCQVRIETVESLEYADPWKGRLYAPGKLRRIDTLRRFDAVVTFSVRDVAAQTGRPMGCRGIVRSICYETVAELDSKAVAWSNRHFVPVRWDDRSARLIARLNERGNPELGTDLIEVSHGRWVEPDRTT